MSSQGAGVFKSTDNGVTWAQANDGLDVTKNITSLALKGDSILAGSYQKALYYSSNNGTTWVNIGTGITNQQVMDIVVSGKNIIVATLGGVFKSTNGGAAWAAINTGLPAEVYSQFMSIENGVLYLGILAKGLYRSADLGASWSRVSDISETARMSSLIQVNSKLFAAGDAGLFVSENNGVSWAQTGTGLPMEQAPILGSRGTTLYFGANQGIFISTDNGANFTSQPLPSELTPSDRDVNCFAVVGDVMFTGFWRSGIYRSNDGSTWTKSNTGFNGLSTTSILNHKGVMYTVGTRGVFKSTDGGTSWSEFSIAGQDAIYDISLKGDSILVRATPGGSLLSLNNGSTWNPLPQTANNILMLSSAGTHFFGFNSSGLYRHLPFGTNWARTLEVSAPIVVFLKIHQHNSDLFAVAYGNHWMSSDNGTNWATKSNGLPSPPVYISDVVRHKNKYYIASGHGVFVTSDFGNNWTKLTSTELFSPVTVTSDGTYLYVGTNEGFFMSHDDGATFFDIGDATSRKVLPRTMTTFDGKLFVGADDGVWSITPTLTHGITSFAPRYGKAGDVVAITGTNFSTSPAHNKVKFNGVSATVTEATKTSLKVTVPAGASTGKLSVEIAGITHLTTEDYCFGMQNPIITVVETGAAYPSLVSNNTSGNQWFRNGVAIAGAIDQTYVIVDDGVYTVQITNGTCVTGMSGEFVITGTEEYGHASTLGVFPIPASNEITIDLSPFREGYAVSIEMTNTLGQQKLLAMAPGKTTQTINISALPEGVYLVHASQQGKTRTKRLTIRR